jgi:uncharacterized membrane protein YfhO
MIEKNSLQKQGAKRQREGQRIDRHRYAVLLSFLLTGSLLTVLFMVLQFYPFGEHAIILSDLGAQYAPDLIAYKNQLLSGGGWTYSFIIGMGKNTFGLFAYYLSSPVNFVTFLFPSHMIAESVLVLIGIKLSLASAFMTLYLRSRFHGPSYDTILFGIIYAFSSYAMVYMINIMWLDGFLLLPLLLYFVDQFLENHARWWRVTLALWVLFVSGFYIAYMVGIFAFLYLLVRLYEKRAFAGPDRKNAGKTVLRFILCAVLATGLSAALLLPAGMDILGNPDRSAGSFSLTSNFSFVRLLNQFLTGSFDSLSSNKPLIYCGLLVFLLVGLFFLNPHFSRRQKVLAGGAIAFLILSFNMSVLSVAWQLFDAPNWFQYRHSFLLIFVLLVISFASLRHIQELSPKAFAVMAIVFFSLLVIVQYSGDLSDEGARFYINFILGGLILGCLYGMSGVSFHPSIANVKRLVPAMMVIIVCIEVVMVNPLYIRPKMFGGEAKREPLSSVLLASEPLADRAKENEKALDTAFFRMETDGALSDAMGAMNAGLYLHYPSVSTFNSSSNKDLNRFLKQLGYDTNYNYFASTHAYTSIVPDSLLGIKYILSAEEQLGGYDLIESDPNETVYLYYNPSALPLLFLVEPDAADFDAYQQEREPDNKNLFVFQEELLVSLFGEDAFAEPVYIEAKSEGPVLYNAIAYAPMDKSPEIMEMESISLSKAKDTDLLGEEPVWIIGKDMDSYLRISQKDQLTLSYSITITSDNPLYLSLPVVTRNDEADIYVNGAYKDNLSSSSFSRIISLGTFAPGDVVAVTVRASSDIFSSMPAQFYYCDTELFIDQLSDAVAGQDVQIRTIKDGYVSAQVTTKEDKLLLTTIPYEKGWTLRVDGKETDITAYQNALIGIPLTPGTHTVTLSFTPPGLWAGIIINGAAILFFAAAVVITIRKRSRAL